MIRSYFSMDYLLTLIKLELPVPNHIMGTVEAHAAQLMFPSCKIPKSFHEKKESRFTLK